MDIPEIMGQVLFFSGLAVLGMVISKIVHLDLTLSCLVAGIVGSLSLAWLEFDTGIRAANIKNLVFYAILPVLIFEAAWHIKPALLKRWLIPIISLSTLGVIASCAVVGVILFYSIGSPSGFPWIAAILTGAILAATDPIAVVASLKQLKAPENLTTLVEGESLFNDATALVLFGTVLTFAIGAGSDANQNYGALFLTTFFGGLAVGGVVGLVGVMLVLFLRTTATTNILLVVVAFSSFYVAEHFFHVSGIMSVVCAALLSRVMLKEHKHGHIEGIDFTWEWLGSYFNAIIFVLMGLVIQFEMFVDQWLAILIAIPAALLGRAVAVYGCTGIVRAIGKAVPFNWQHILVWGGLRGAIAIVLVLSLPESLSYRWTIQSMVFGVVLFSLLVQGSTTFLLIKRST